MCRPHHWHHVDLPMVILFYHLHCYCLCLYLCCHLNFYAIFFFFFFFYILKQFTTIITIIHFLKTYFCCFRWFDSGIFLVFCFAEAAEATIDKRRLLFERAIVDGITAFIHFLHTTSTATRARQRRVFATPRQQHVVLQVTIDETAGAHRELQHFALRMEVILK